MSQLINKAVNAEKNNKSMTFVVFKYPVYEVIIFGWNGLNSIKERRYF
jgi:hypothetical protein